MAPQFAQLRQRHGILRMITLLLGLIGLAFIIADLNLQNTDALIAYELATYPAISITANAWTILWCLSAILVLLFHGPYPPGVDIGLDLIGWGLALGFGVLLLYQAGYYNYAEDCDSEYVTAHECSLARSLMAVEVLAAIFALAFGACHLYFMFKGIKTEIASRRDRRNKSVHSELKDNEQLNVGA